MIQVTNRLKGLDLIDRVPEELWMEVHDIVQQAGIKIIPKKKKGKMVVCLTNSYEKKRSERQRRKGKMYPFECRVPKNSRRVKKAFLSDQCKEIEENNKWKRLEISSRKLEIPREHFMHRWAQ